MVVVEVDNPKITEKYTQKELNYLFSKMIQFLENEDRPILYQVDIDELPEHVRADIETADEEIEYVNL